MTTENIIQRSGFIFRCNLMEIDIIIIIIIIIIMFICKAPYIQNNFLSEAHKIHCSTYIFKIFIISLNLHVKTKC